jgi:N-methylhydantoinase A
MTERTNLTLTPDGFRIAVDIGGTFTDCVVLDAAGRKQTAKSPTTPQDPSEGVLAAVAVAAVELGLDLESLLRRTTSFVHGSTIGTNTFVQRNGARTGLLMTRGHEESIIIGRVKQKVAGLSEREKIHVAHLHKAEPPLVARSDIRGIDERVDYRGDVLVSIRQEQVEQAVDDLLRSGVESLAVCLLWSFVNPTHEQFVRDLVRSKYPDVFLTVSSDLIPVLGEYERCVSTCLNSYIGPAVARYLDRLRGRLAELSYRYPLLVMQSNGGLSPIESMRDKPILTLDSGPVGGILGSKYFGEQQGQRNLICTDVGGTTFDVGLVFDGESQLDTAPVIDQYAYSLPKVLLRSIGAGGGSIAWMDQAGALRVGPRSAGASTGPACYGRGGTEPTLTDADVVLGYLNPDNFLGGRMRLDPDAAHAAIRRLAERLGLDEIKTASGIFDIANAQMADLIRKSTVERGFDPRDFVVLAYGGAGPAHAAFYSADAGASATYIPADSSVFSALGMLTTDILFTAETTHLMRAPLSEEKLARISGIFRHLEEQVLSQFRVGGLADASVSLGRTVDMRFGMQVHELPVPVPLGPIATKDGEDLLRAFEQKYEFVYGRDTAYREAGIELTTLRVVGRVATGRYEQSSNGLVHESELKPYLSRPAYFRGAGGFIETPRFRGEDLCTGHTLVGPAIVERMGDTVVIPTGTTASVDHVGNLVLRV